LDDAIYGTCDPVKCIRDVGFLAQTGDMYKQRWKGCMKVSCKEIGVIAQKRSSGQRDDYICMAVIHGNYILDGMDIKAAEIGIRSRINNPARFRYNAIVVWHSEIIMIEGDELQPDDFLGASLAQHNDCSRRMSPDKLIQCLMNRVPPYW